MGNDKVIDLAKWKRTERKKRFQQRLASAKKWCSDNRSLLVLLASGTMWLASASIKAGVRQHTLKKEEHVKNEYCYDRSLGHYWELRRKLTNAEWVIIDKRKKNGERLGNILEDLKVLK